MFSPVIAVQCGIRAVRGAALSLLAAAAVTALAGCVATHAGTVSPAAAVSAAADVGDLHEFLPLSATEIGADPAPCREAGLRRTEHDAPVGGRGKAEGAVAWAGDPMPKRLHRGRSLPHSAGTFFAPCVDLSRLCRLTC